MPPPMIRRMVREASTRALPFDGADTRRGEKEGPELLPEDGAGIVALGRGGRHHRIELSVGRGVAFALT